MIEWWQTHCYKLVGRLAEARGTFSIEVKRGRLVLTIRSEPLRHTGFEDWYEWLNVESDVVYL